MKVVLTDQSLERLEESLLFYIEKLGMPKEKAFTLKEQLLQKAESLARNPFKGQVEPYLKKNKLNYRRVVFGNFKIIYRVENQTIFVTDFFDSRKSPFDRMK